MVEDELLKLKFKCGSREALCRIYQKYHNHLLTLAMGLLNDVNLAEDVLHDVFVSFAKSAENFRLRGSLKSYLATSVVNRARDRIRAKRRERVRLHDMDVLASGSNGPEQSVICTEESLRVNCAIAQLPYEQREVIILRLNGRMKFKEIAGLQGVSVNTIQGRYRYGLKKLRSILNGEVKK